MPRARTPRSIANSIDRDYQQTRKKIEDAMSRCEPGSTAYLNHVRALYDVARLWRQERCDRQIDAASLGVAVTRKFEFRAEVEQSPEFDKAEDQRIREELDREFGDLPAAEPEDNTEISGTAPAQQEDTDTQEPIKSDEKK